MHSKTNPLRRFDPPLFSSSSLPKLTIQLSPNFAYLGHTDFTLNEIAQVERHHFAELEQSRISRQLIFQFERFLPSSDEIYRWPVRNPIQLADHTYQHNVFAFSQAESISQNPSGESAHTQSFLSELGYSPVDELVAARFARVIGPDKRHELIIFYFENVVAHANNLAELSKEGYLRPAFKHLEQPLIQRALQAFTILKQP